MSTRSSRTTGDLVAKVEGDQTPDTTPTPASFPQFFAEKQARIERLLPQGMSVERFMQLIVNQVRANPDLGACTYESILGAAMTAAQSGLEPGPLGFAYLVPRWNSRHHRDPDSGRWVGAQECQLLLGYRGLVALAYRSKLVASVEAHAVYPGDVFKVRRGLDEQLVHEPEVRTADRGGEPWAYWALARFANGAHAWEVMDLDDIEEYRLRSDRQKKDGGSRKDAWLSDYDAMAKKTVFRRLVPWLPLEDRLAEIISKDETVTTIDDPMPVPIDVHVTESPPAASADRGGDGSPEEAGDAPAGSSGEPQDEPEPEPGDDLDEITDRDRLKRMAEDAGCDVPPRASVATLRSLIREARVKAEPADGDGDGGEG